MKNWMSGSFVFWGLFVALLCLAFISLWQRVRMTRVGYEIQEMQHHKKKLVKLHRELLIEVESLNALDRIEEKAVSQLSMRPAQPGERIYIGQELAPSGS